MTLRQDVEICYLDLLSLGYHPEHCKHQIDTILQIYIDHKDMTLHDAIVHYDSVVFPSVLSHLYQDIFEPSCAHIEHREDVKRGEHRGQRCDVPAPNGVSYSFGPHWVNAVVNKKPLALKETNLPKLQHHARILNLSEVDIASFSAEQLCDFISSKQ